VRVYRKKPGPATDVHLHFLYSEYGLGNQYVDAGDTIIHFNDRDPFQTLRSGYKWQLPPDNSNHNCLAVEISTETDPIIAPGLVNLVPGWNNGTDLMVFNDNNKAQRNMGLFTTTGTGPGSPMPAPGGPAAGTMSMATAVMYAVIHNPTLDITDMQIRPVINPIAKTKPRTTVIGDKGSTTKPNGDIILTRMNPGESRILRISYAVPTAKEGKSFSLTYNQVKKDVVVNAFTILNQYASADKVIRENLRFEGAVLTRINALHKNIDTATVMIGANSTISAQQPTGSNYQDYLKRNISLLKSVAVELIGANHKDPFGLSVAIKTLQDRMKTKDFASIADAHLSLLNTIDAYLTFLQLQKGNAADILQTMRLQSALVRRISQNKDTTVKHLLELSGAFINAFEKRKLTSDDYPSRLKNMISDLKAVAIRFGKADDRLMSSLKTMEEKSEPAELQGEHIRFLLSFRHILEEK